jgi:ParB-like chromosome segregation protein Spo0J
MNIPFIAEAIESRRVDELIPDIRNPRTHSKKQMSQLTACIAENGFTSPVLIDSSGVIIAGNARLGAARMLGMERVPVIVLGPLTELQKRAYVIADNKVALNAEWDLHLLRQEVAAAEAELRKLDVFSEQEYEELLAEFDQEQAPANAPLPPLPQRSAMRSSTQQARECARYPLRRRACWQS